MGMMTFRRTRAAEKAAQEAVTEESGTSLKLDKEEYAEMTRNKANVMQALSLYGQEFDEKASATDLKEQLNAFLEGKGLIPNDAE
jgi:hypothetical protein